MDARQVRLGQVLIAEVALVGVVAASVGPGWLLLGVAAAAAAVGVATFGRSGGRWWYQAVRSHQRLRRRRRQAAAGVVAATLAARTPLALVWLRTMAPELSVRPVNVAGTVVGVAFDGAGWYGAVASSGIEMATLADLGELVRPGQDRIALSTVQLVRHGPRAWLAVRLSPVDAVAVDHIEGGLEAAVALGVMRAARLLRKHGYEATALDPPGLLAALVVANGLDAAPQEHWSAWSSGSLAHVTYAASAWPPELLLTKPGVWAVTATLDWDERSPDRLDHGAGPGSDDPLLGGVLLRVAGEPGGLPALCRGLARSAARSGVRLRRLDGDQAPAAYACGPSAMPAHGFGADLSTGRRRPGGPGLRDRGASPGIKAHGVHH